MEQREAFGGGQSSALVEVLCQQAGVEFKETFSTREVVELLDKLEYRIDTATVARFCRLKYIGQVVDATFNHEQVHRLLAALEVRRYWQPGSRVHQGKFSAAEQEYHKFGGDPGYLRELSIHSLEDLLLMLVAENNRQLRECLLVSIKHKLRELGTEE
jgi:hypothetical protein